MVIASFPHNPTTTVVDAAFMQALVDFARERELVVVHDFAYADIAFDGHQPPSILAAEGARECAVELYTLTKGFSMAGWRVGFCVGNAEVVAGLGRLKSYLDYGTFQPIQIAATVTMREAAEYPVEVCEIYRGRRDALCDGLRAPGWEVPRPRGTMFVWAPIPEEFRELGRSSSRCGCCARPTSRSARAAASARAATATSASRWSRTSSGSGRRCAASGACSRRR